MKKAHALGIETVYQDKSLGEKQAMWRNFFIGREITYPFGFLKVKEEKQIANEIMVNTIGFRGKGIGVDSKANKLSGGERQGVAIGRAMHFEADLIILDEPTVALSLKEVRKVLNFVHKIKEAGKASIYISHNITDVYEISDRFIVIDRGEIVASIAKAKIIPEGAGRVPARVLARPEGQGAAMNRSNLSSCVPRQGSRACPIAIVLAVLYVVFIFTAPSVFTGYRIYMSFFQTVPPMLVLRHRAHVHHHGGRDRPELPRRGGAVGVRLHLVLQELPDAPWIGFILALASGALVGYINGLLVARLRVPSIMATLAAQFFWYGVTVLIAGGLQINIQDDHRPRRSTPSSSAACSGSSPSRRSGRWGSPCSSGSSSTGTSSARPSCSSATTPRSRG